MTPAEAQELLDRNTVNLTAIVLGHGFTADQLARAYIETAKKLAKAEAREQRVRALNLGDGCPFVPPPGGGYVCYRCGAEFTEHPQAVKAFRERASTREKL